MKKTILAMAIPAMLATSVQAVELYDSEDGSVDFYGQIRAYLGQEGENGANLGFGSSRAGVHAQFDISESSYTFGRYEFGIPGGTGSPAMETRVTYVGLGGDWGELSFGKQWLLQDDIYGADYSYAFGGTVIRYVDSSARHDALTKYNFTGESFWLAASYGLENEEDVNGTKVATLPQVAELFLGFDFADTSIYGGVANRDEQNPVGSNYKQTAYTATVEQGLGDFLIGLTYYGSSYEQGPAELTENAFALAGTWDWGKGTAYTGYEYITNDPNAAAISAIGGTETPKDNFYNFYIGTDYHFNQWARVFLEGAVFDGALFGASRGDDDISIDPGQTDGSQTAIRLGMRAYW